MAVDGIFLNNDSQVKVVGADYDNSEMNREQFLQVLLATIQWQDPLQAEDITDFINNTVKLREMEVLNSFESSVEDLKSSLKSAELFYATSFIGQKVLYQGNETYVNNGKGKFYFELESPASYVEVSVLDANGNVVEKQVFSSLSAGSYPVEIDNSSLEDGYYTVSVTAKDSNGELMDVKVDSYAMVDGVRRDDDGIYLLTSFGQIPLENVMGIGG